MRVQSQLHITSTFNSQSTDDFQRSISQHLIFPVREGLRRCYDYRIASVYAHRVYVFHVADHYGIVVRISHYFVFYLFESCDGFFYKALIYRTVF